MSQVQLLIAGELMSESKTIHIREVFRHSFLWMHYFLHDPEAKADHEFEPDQKTLEAYIEKIEILNLLDTSEFMSRWKKNPLFNIVDGKATLNFTLEECVERYKKKRATYLAQQANS